MSEMVAYRCMQTLTYLKAKDEATYSLVKDEVEELVSALRKMERLLNNRGNEKEVVDRMGIIRSAVNLVEDVLETWGVLVEAYIEKKNEKKRAISRHVKDSAMRMRETVNLANSAVLNIFPVDVLEGHGMEEYFVGRKDDLENLISLVKQHKVVSIWAVEGLGKTTLARKVYMHPQVRDWFEAFAWINLTQDNEIDILYEIGAGAVKMSAEEHKNGTVDKREGGGEKKRGAKVTQPDNRLQIVKKEGAGERIIGAKEEKTEVAEEEKKKGAQVLQAGNFPQTLTVIRSAVKLRRIAQKKKRVAEKEKKEGTEDETRVANEEKKGGAEDYQTIRFRSRFMIKQGVTAQKNSEVEDKEIVDNEKEGEVEQPKSREENMMDGLKKILRQKKCFIVVDGVSELPQWKKISTAFPMEDANTKILLITDKEEIAGVGFPYPLSSLKEDDGWELLQKYAFCGKKAPELVNLPTLGKEIVRKCEYLPATISSIGRSLSKKCLDEWPKVNDDVQKYLRWDKQSQSDKVLVQSYDDLSYGLKQCFLYLAIFKDVNQDDLSFLWLAEGMVSPQPQQETRKDTAEHYLRELQSKDKFWVQVDELSTKRTFKLLCLDNDAQELSLYKGEREGFFEVVDFSVGNWSKSNSFSLFDGTRRLVIHFNELSSPGQEHNINTLSNLRSLFFLNSSQECVQLPVQISDFTEFTLLRVLHFVRCKFEGRKLPDGIDKLFNLTYLGVLYCDLDELPPSISNVRNLYVLNVRAYDDARITIPDTISKMVRLKHLRLPTNLDRETPEKLELDSLVDLETLDGFNADIHDVDSLSKLQKLRHVGIHARSNEGLKLIIKFVKSHGARIPTDILVEHKCDFILAEGLADLEKLLKCPNLGVLTISVLIDKFPNCGEHASKYLTQIKFIGSKLTVDPMEALGKFPNLRKLSLGHGGFVGEEMNIGAAGFPELEYLEFHRLWNLKKWSVDKGAMKKLSTLIVRQCPRLKQIPQQLKSVQNKILDRQLQSSIQDPKPDAIAEASETDSCPNCGHEIFSWNHVLQALESLILYLRLLTKRMIIASCQAVARAIPNGEQ